MVSDVVLDELSLPGEVLMTNLALDARWKPEYDAVTPQLRTIVHGWQGRKLVESEGEHLGLELNLGYPGLTPLLESSDEAGHVVELVVPRLVGIGPDREVVPCCRRLHEDVE